MLTSSSQSNQVGPGLGLHEILGGGYVVPSTVEDGATPVVSSGVTVSSQTISSAQKQTVLKGGTAIDTTVLAGGAQLVSGTTTGTVLTGSAGNVDAQIVSDSCVD